MKAPLVVIACGFLLALAVSATPTGQPYDAYPGANNVIYWRLFLTTLYRQTPPDRAALLTFIHFARADLMMMSVIYDSWAVYDYRLKPYIATDVRKQGTAENAEKAYSFAAYRVVSSVIGRHSAIDQGKIDAFFAQLGYNKSDTTTDRHFAAGIGNLVAAAVIQDRREDGSNEWGLDPASTGAPYSDHTNFVPINNPFGSPPTDLWHVNCATVRSLINWQPAFQRLPNGAFIPQSIIATAITQWSAVKPFGLDGPSEFRPTAPARLNTPSQTTLFNSINDLLSMFSQLDDAKKADAAFFADHVPAGLSRSSLPGVLAVNAAYKTSMSTRETIKFFLAQTHVQHDIYITVEEAKRFWQAPRPTTLIQCLLTNQTIYTWLGPYQGVGPTTASNWRPYLLEDTVQNPNPEYPCGHCTTAGGMAAFFREWFDSDDFVGYDTVIPAGSFPQDKKRVSGDPGYVAGVTDVPNSGPGTAGYAPANDVTISFFTWSQYAERQSRSRIFLGVHFQHSSDAGMELGQNVALKTLRTVKQKIFNR